MIKIVVRGMLLRRRRTLLSALAVALGVAMIAGSLIYTETVRAAFRTVLSGGTQGADLIVASRQDFAAQTDAAPATIPAALLSKVRHLPGIARAYPQIVDQATPVGGDGKPLDALGLTLTAASYVPPPLGTMRLLSGQIPTGGDQVGIDPWTASREGWHPGSSIELLTAQPVRRFTVAGIISAAPGVTAGTTLTTFAIGTAQALFGKHGSYDRILIGVAAGSSRATVMREVASLLPSDLTVRTGAAETDAQFAELSARLNLLTDALLAFGAITVLLAGLAIFNACSISVAQRTRELSLLRLLGAARRQLFAIVLAESLAVGLVATVAGVALGFLVAMALRALMRVLGLELPEQRLVFSGAAAAAGLGSGLAVSAAAAVIPALRAARVAPLEAVRSASLPRPKRKPAALAASLIARLAPAAAGVVLIASGGGASGGALLRSASGSILIVVSLVAVSPLVIGPLTRAVSWPLELRGGVLMRIAREHAERTPTRTAISASSLMIGVALVLFVTVFANGLRSSTERIVRQSLRADFTLESADGVRSIPPASVRAAALTPGALTVSGIERAQAKIGPGGPVSVEGVQPETIGQVVALRWVDGTDASLSGLLPGDALIEQDTARSRHIGVGELLTLRAETGRRTSVIVRGIYQERALLTGLLLPSATFDGLFRRSQLHDVFIRLDGTIDPITARAALNHALRSFPGVVARSIAAVAARSGSRLNSIFALFYGLLAIAVLMSVLGIVNTMSLSILDRTGELGTLRALGMSPAQARSLIRHESLLTAAIGTLVGGAVGLLLAWVLTRTVATDGITFAVPWLQVLAVMAAGLALGLIAAVGPARRASRVDLLSAIAHL